MIPDIKTKKNSFTLSYRLKINMLNRMISKPEVEQLFRQYYLILSNFAHGYIRDRMLVEEIVNDVFIRFWENRSHITIRSSPKDYLFKSAQNACIDLFLII